MPRKTCCIPARVSREKRSHLAIAKRGTMEDQLVEMLAWLFTKTEEEILAEAEVAALYSMLHGEDPRPERAGNSG
jgi:hypothetical protein